MINANDCASHEVSLAFPLVPIGRSTQVHSRTPLAANPWYTLVLDADPPTTGRRFSAHAKHFTDGLQGLECVHRFRLRRLRPSPSSPPSA